MTMANKPFDRTVINVRERPLSSDINLLATYQDLALRSVVDQLHSTRSRTIGDPTSQGPYTGFVGDGFRVKAKSPAALAIKVSAGIGFYLDAADVPVDIGSVSGVNDTARYKPLSLSADEEIVVPAPDPVNPRIDIIEVKIDRRLQDPLARDIFDVGTSTFVGGVVNKALSFYHDGRQGTVNSPNPSTTGIGYKTGVAAGAPAVPATTAGYIKIAEIQVGAAVANITDLKIRDCRPQLAPNGSFLVSAHVVRTAGVVTAKIFAPPGVKATVNMAAVSPIAALYVMLGDTSWEVASWVQLDTGAVDVIQVRFVEQLQAALAQASAVDSAAFAGADSHPAIDVFGGATNGQNYALAWFTLVDMAFNAAPAVKTNATDCSFWVYMQLNRTV